MNVRNGMVRCVRLPIGILAAVAACTNGPKGEPSPRKDTQSSRSTPDQAAATAPADATDPTRDASIVELMNRSAVASGELFGRSSGLHSAPEPPQRGCEIDCELARHDCAPGVSAIQRGVTDAEWAARDQALAACVRGCRDQAGRPARYVCPFGADTTKAVQPPARRKGTRADVEADVQRAIETHATTGGAFAGLAKQAPGAPPKLGGDACVRQLCDAGERRCKAAHRPRAQAAGDDRRALADALGRCRERCATSEYSEPDSPYRCPFDPPGSSGLGAGRLGDTGPGPSP